MKLRELAYGALWLASVVEVAQFTWTAYMATYDTFPDTGGGTGGGSGSLTQNLGLGATPTNLNQGATTAKRALDQTGPVLGTLGHAVETKPGQSIILDKIPAFFNQIFGGSGTQRSAPPAGKKAPPTNLVTAVRRAAAHPTQRGASLAVQNFTKWAYKNNWTSRDVTTYFKNIGVM